MKRLVLLVLLVAVVVTACGGDDGEGVATLESTTSTVASPQGGQSTAERDEQSLLAFAACMRDNGVEDFPDPRLNADGSVDFGADQRPLADVDEDVFESAFDVCLDELEGLSFAPGGSDFDFTAIQDTFVAFSACMREQGVDIPDPDFSNFGLGGGAEGLNPFGAFDFEDPQVLAAVEQCQEVFTDLGLGG